MYQALVSPGEMVYIPSGWYYCYIALEHSISISQGFTSESNFDNVWRAVRYKNPRLAFLWFEFIERFEPIMIRRLKKANEKDGCPDWCKEYEEKRNQKIMVPAQY